MKLPRFIFISIFITCLCLLYVYQQTEIFRLAYLGGKKKSRLEDLLDKKAILRYNIDSSSSVVRLAEKVSATADFQIPEDYRWVRIGSEREISLDSRLVKQPTFLSRVFSIKRQAEAKTTNSP